MQLKLKNGDFQLIQTAVSGFPQAALMIQNISLSKMVRLHQEAMSFKKAEVILEEIAGS